MSFLKTIIAAAGLFFLFSTGVQAQGFYAKLGGGYNFGIGSAIVYQREENTDYSPNTFPSPVRTQKFERVNINHGKGSVFGASFGYMFNNNLGFELGVNYLAGAKSEFKNEENIFGSGIISPFSGNSATTEMYTSKSQMVLVQSSLVMAAGLPKLDPYTRIGLVAAKGSIKNTYDYSNSNGETTETEEELSGGWGFGLQAALGLNFSLNDKIAIYTEGTFNNLTYAPEKGEVTKYNRNGTDQMHTLQTSQKETNFENDHTTTSNSSQPSSEPSTGPKQRYTLNSVGLNVGLKFSF